ncbi:MAG TPA: hypothetical protein VFZ66_08825 [Herpetosiphonaceae bacterium]
MRLTKMIAPLIALALATGGVTAAAPKKAEQHCVVVLGEEQNMQCYSSADEVVVPQGHIKMATLFDGGKWDGATLSIYNNDTVGSCGGGVPNLGALGWDNRVSSFANHCGILTFYYGTNYCCAMSPGYGQGWFSFTGTTMDNNMSSLRW